MSVSDVSFNEDILVITVDDTAPPEIAITPAPIVVEIAGSGLQGPPGPQGPQGPPGSGVAGSFYRHSQMTSSNEWLIVHNLGYNPSVNVQDSAGTNCETEITYIDVNSCYSRTVNPFTGTADCS